MIIYFADRELNILGHASTMLPAGYRVFDDLTVEEVGTGVNTFSCSLSFTDESRADLEEAVQVGCFILKQSDADDSDNTYDSLYQIIETETDTKTQEIHLYAEDAGLDLLNTLCPAVALTGNISYMLRYFLPSDWSLSISDAPTTSKTYAWDGESTATERLMSVANLFDCELYYSFVIEGLQVKSKVLNVEQRRGEQTATAQLRLNYDVDRIYTKKSIADLVTAYNVTGGTPEGSETPINLKGYSYSYTDPVTGDVYRVDSATGQMRNISAMARWSSVIDSDGLWVGSFTFDTTDKSILAGQARASLQKESQVAVNYEVDFARLPEGTRIGDRINIIDELGELYLEARLLQIETCAANDTKKAVIGEYLIREGGISEKVAQLAADLANQREADKVIQAQMQIITDTVDGMFTLEVDSDVVLSQAYLTARLLKGNKDIKTDYDPNWFKWILRSENGERLLGRGYTLTVNMNIIGYASTILCRFIRPQLYDLTDHNLTAITDANLDPIQVSFAGIYNQPVVTRNLLKSRLKSLRATPTVEVGEPNVTREVNLYERNGFADSVALFTGNKGGYVVLKPNEDGQPEEILVMDTPDIETAVNVWRWNKEGIGYSADGYNGTYSTAWTIDGTFVADFIKVGTMLANRIKGGTLTLGGYDNQNGIFRLESASGFTVGLLDNTGIVYTSEETFHRANYHPQFRRSTIFDSGQVGFRVQQITNGQGDAVTMGPEILGSISPALTSLDITFDTDNSMNSALGLDYGAVSLIAKAQNRSNQLDVGIDSGGNGYVKATSDVYMENSALWFGNYFAIGYPSGLYNYAIGHHNGSRIDSGLAFRQSGNNNVVGIYVYNTSLSVGTGGTKSKLFETDKEERAMYCYEMPTPIFGDIGCGATDETGVCVVTIDKMFSDGSNTDIEYQVFLQKENQGDLWVAEKTPTFFVVRGTPELSFSWEIKAKQRNFEGLRMEIENTETPYMDWLNDEPDYLEQGSELFTDYLSEFN